jgi:PAS domain S-box-containing protein
LSSRKPPIPDDATLLYYALEVGLWELDLDASLLVVSATWEKLLGFDAGAFSGTWDSWLELVDVRDRARVELELLTHTEGLAEVFETECRAHRRDGSPRWLRVRGRLQERGGRRVLAGYLEDITERRSEEQKRAASESRFRTLVDKCPDAIALFRDGRFIRVNRRFASLLGYEEESALVGALVLSCVHGEDRAQVAARVRNRQAGTSEEALGEVRLLHKNGSIVTVELSDVVLEFEGAATVFLVARDVSERKRLQARLAHADRMASLGTLAAGVAHEINNPLSFVTANLQTLMNDLPVLLDRLESVREELGTALGPEGLRQLTEKAGPLLDPTTFVALQEQALDALHGARRMTTIVTDLRHFARADVERRDVVDLKRVLETALKMAAHEIKYRARVVREFADALPVIGDEGRLCQVFLNVLVNAAHAIEARSVDDNEIRVVLRNEGSFTVVQVSDTGRGISPDEVNRVFEPFYTTKPPGIGSGLGLFICRHIVEDHQGLIEIESRMGAGSVVTIRLPASPERARAAEPDSFPPPSSERVYARHSRTILPGPGGERLRILVIDDEPILCRSLQRALSPEADVVIAFGGRQAVEMLERDSQFDLVFCDMMMLDMPGEAVFEWVSERHPELARNIVFITGGATTASARSFLERTQNRVIQKPIDVDKLRELVRRTLRRDSFDTAAPGERRRGTRVAGSGIAGVLRTEDILERLTVVDLSATGLRVSGARRWPDGNRAGPIALSLHRASTYVQVLARPIRHVATNSGVDLCVEVDSMDESSRDIYMRWLTDLTDQTGQA